MLRQVIVPSHDGKFLGPSHFLALALALLAQTLA